MDRSAPEKIRAAVLAAPPPSLSIEIMRIYFRRKMLIVK
jgi:hypothetical protein